MPSRLIDIFEDQKLVAKIKKRLLYLFQLAELESSMAGKTGMEVGSLRERVIIALLIYKFGQANVETNIPITEPEVDVKLFGEPISIKTITGKALGGVNLSGPLTHRRRKNLVARIAPNVISYLFKSTGTLKEACII